MIGFIVVVLLMRVVNACDPTSIILPLMRSDIGCSGTSSSYEELNCKEFVDIMSGCCVGFARMKELVMIPPFDQPFSCTNTFTCRPYFLNDDFELALKPGRNYTVKEHLEQQIKSKAGNCVNDSIALILTDIPCSEYSKYPDLQGLFGDNNLQHTIKWLTSFHLLTVVFYLNQSGAEQCTELSNYKFNNETDYLQLYKVSYKEAASDPYTDACSWKLPIKRPKQTLSDGAKVGISIAGALCLALMLGVIIFLGLRVRRRYHESKMEWFAEQHTLNARSLLFGRTRKVDEWEVTPLNLRIETDHTIGSGISAAVYKGYLKRDGEVERIVVAAKFAHTYSSLMSKKAMMKEIELMKTPKLHPNIVKFYGCVSKIEQPAIITEFCSNGDLLKHLQTQELLVSDLHRIASEVCSAMVHLGSLGLVHRDLAARNVFLTDAMTAKVGDFGLCRKVGGGLTAEDKGEKLPVTHMPFESLKFGEFSEKSDVWSFGCLLFEMFSGGRRPFSDVEPSDLIEYLEEDRKPEFLEDTPLEIVQLGHSKCFVKDNEERGTFVDIQELLNQN